MLGACGGVMVSVVFTYADVVLKSFAVGLSIVLSALEPGPEPEPGPGTGPGPGPGPEHGHGPYPRCSPRSPPLRSSARDAHRRLP